MAPAQAAEILTDLDKAPGVERVSVMILDRPEDEPAAIAVSNEGASADKLSKKSGTSKKERC